MSTFTAPEPGWYEQDLSAPGGWQRISDYEALPSGQMIPARTATIVTFDTEPFGA